MAVLGEADALSELKRREIGASVAPIAAEERVHTLARGNKGTCVGASARLCCRVKNRHLSPASIQRFEASI